MTLLRTLALLGALAIHQASAQMTQETARSFVQRVQAKLTMLASGRQFTMNIPQGSNSGNWIKIEESLLSSSVDVKRTDSIAEPVEGVIEFVAVVRGSERATSKAEADALPIIFAPNADIPITVQAVFIPTATGWIYRSGRYTTSPTIPWLQITPEVLHNPLSERIFPHKILRDIEQIVANAP